MACGFPELPISKNRCAESSGGIKTLRWSGEIFNYTYAADSNGIDPLGKIVDIVPATSGTKFKYLHTFKEGDAAPNFSNVISLQDNGAKKYMLEGTFTIAQDSPEIRAILDKIVGKTCDLLVEYKAMEDKWEIIRDVKFTNCAWDSNSRRHVISYKLEDGDYKPTLVQAPTVPAVEPVEASEGVQAVEGSPEINTNTLIANII